MLLLLMLSHRLLTRSQLCHELRSEVVSPDSPKVRVEDVVRAELVGGASMAQVGENQPPKCGEHQHGPCVWAEVRKQRHPNANLHEQRDGEELEELGARLLPLLLFKLLLFTGRSVVVGAVGVGAGVGSAS